MKLGIFLILVSCLITFGELINSIWWYRAFLAKDFFWLGYHFAIYIVIGILPLWFGIKRIGERA